MSLRWNGYKKNPQKKVKQFPGFKLGYVVFPASSRPTLQNPGIP